MTPTNIAAHIEAVDDELPKSEAALNSLLEQLRERQDRVAAELTEWRKIGKTPAIVSAHISGIEKQYMRLREQLTAWKEAAVSCPTPEAFAVWRRQVLEFSDRNLSLVHEHDSRIESLEAQILAWQTATGCETVEEYLGRENTEIGCPVHDGAIHGDEAEALRKGIERLIECTDSVDSDELQKLLDGVHACDSLGYLEHVERELKAKLSNAEARIATLEAYLMRVAEAVGEVAIVDGEDKRSCIDTIVHVASDAMDAKERVPTLEAELKTLRECEASNIRELHKADAVFGELRAERDAAQARCAELERRCVDFESSRAAWKVSADERYDEITKLRSQLEALTKAPEGDVLADWSCPAPRNPDQFGPTTLETIKRHFTYGESLEKYMNALRAEVRRLRSQLATVTAERDGLRSDLEGMHADLTAGRHVGVRRVEKALEALTSSGSAPARPTPQANPLCVPEPSASAITCWCNGEPPCAHKCPETPAKYRVPEPRTLTAEEVERHLMDGSQVNVGGNLYRRFGDYLEIRIGDQWKPWVSLGTGKRQLLDRVRQNGLRCTLVPDPSQEQEVRS